ERHRPSLSRLGRHQGPERAGQHRRRHRERAGRPAGRGRRGDPGRLVFHRRHRARGQPIPGAHRAAGAPARPQLRSRPATGLPAFAGRVHLHHGRGHEDGPRLPGAGAGLPGAAPRDRRCRRPRGGTEPGEPGVPRAKRTGAPGRGPPLAGAGRSPGRRRPVPPARHRGSRLLLRPQPPQLRRVRPRRAAALAGLETLAAAGRRRHPLRPRHAALCIAAPALAEPLCVRPRRAGPRRARPAPDETRAARAARAAAVHRGDRVVGDAGRAGLVAHARCGARRVAAGGSGLPAGRDGLAQALPGPRPLLGRVLVRARGRARARPLHSAPAAPRADSEPRAAGAEHQPAQGPGTVLM
ncbi:MAG: Putative glycosyltransferase, partial [uncultured Ramlibacter sp.]